MILKKNNSPICLNRSQYDIGNIRQIEPIFSVFRIIILISIEVAILTLRIATRVIGHVRPPEAEEDIGNITGIISILLSSIRGFFEFGMIILIYNICWSLMIRGHFII